MRTVAVGLSKFETGDLRSLPFAAADARHFAESVQSRGGVTSLTDGEATIASVRDALHHLAQLAANDSGMLFVATHVVDHEDEVQLQFFDGAISLREMLGAIWNGPTAKLVVLLDLYRDVNPQSRPLATSIAAIFPPRAGRMLLLSDDGRHGSHVSGELQAGVWASHLSSAFRGDAARAQEENGAITVASLREYLAEEIPRSLARAYRSGRQQSPVIFASSDEEVLVEPLEPTVAEMTTTAPLAGVRFFVDREVPVKALGGFRKGVHSAPNDRSASSREWVARLAEPDLASELEQTVARFREHLKYKRRDVRADGPADGAASVLTPDFSYHLTVGQHTTKPDVAVFRRSLTEITNAAIFNRAGLADAFPAAFLSLSQPFDVPADIERLIDALEDGEPPALAKLDYPTDLAYCTLDLRGFDGQVRIDRDGLTINAAGPASPKALAAQFALVKRILKDAGA